MNYTKAKSETLAWFAGEARQTLAKTVAFVNQSVDLYLNIIITFIVFLLYRWAGDEGDDWCGVCFVAVFSCCKQKTRCQACRHPTNLSLATQLIFPCALGLYALYL